MPHLSIWFHCPVCHLKHHNVQVVNRRAECEGVEIVFDADWRPSIKPPEPPPPPEG